MSLNFVYWGGLSLRWMDINVVFDGICFLDVVVYLGRGFGLVHSTSWFAGGIGLERSFRKIRDH